MRYLILLSFLAWLAAGEPSIPVTVVGIQVIQAPPRLEEAVAFTGTPGTAIVLRLGALSADFAAIDRAASRLVLTSSRGAIGSASAENLRVDACEPRYALLVATLSETPLTADGLRLTGSVRVLTGGMPATARHPGLALAAGTTFTGGTATFTITSVGPSEWKPGGTDVVIQSSGDALLVRAIRFLGADGADLPFEAFEQPGTTGVRRGFLFDRLPVNPVIAVEHREGAVAVTVAVDLAVGLGR